MKVQFHMLDGRTVHAKMNSNAVEMIAGMNKFIMGADAEDADGNPIFNGQFTEMTAEQSAALDVMAKAFPEAGGYGKRDVVQVDGKSYVCSAAYDQVSDTLDQASANRRDAALEGGQSHGEQPECSPIERIVAEAAAFRMLADQNYQNLHQQLSALSARIDTFS